MYQGIYLQPLSSRLVGTGTFVIDTFWEVRTKVYFT